MHGELIDWLGVWLSYPTYPTVHPFFNKIPLSFSVSFAFYFSLFQLAQDGTQ